MIDFRSGREPKSSSFDYIAIRIASPEEIRGPRDPKERERLELQGLRSWWSWGEVTKPLETRAPLVREVVADVEAASILRALDRDPLHADHAGRADREERHRGEHLDGGEAAPVSCSLSPGRGPRHGALELIREAPPPGMMTSRARPAAVVTALDPCCWRVTRICTKELKEIVCACMSVTAATMPAPCPT